MQVRPWLRVSPAQIAGRKDRVRVVEDDRRVAAREFERARQQTFGTRLGDATADRRAAREDDVIEVRLAEKRRPRIAIRGADLKISLGKTGRQREFDFAALSVG